MPLSILTIRKELHGFLFLCIRVVPFSIIMGLRLAALRAAGAPLKTFKTFAVFNLKAGLIASHYYLAGVTEKQKQRDRRRFEHASEKEAGLLSRDGLISMFHPEENPNMFGIIVEVRFCCVLCSL